MTDTKLVLAIDDDEDVTEMLSVILVLAGFSVSTANSAFEGMKALSEELPDVVLLDIMMPGVDGMQFCAALRDSPETAHIPVIFVSARRSVRDHETATAAGAVAYVTKPFSVETLVAALNEALSAVPGS